MAVIDDIKTMRVQGAINIAEAGLRHLKKTSKKYGFSARFYEECRKLVEARPTAVPLFNVVEKIREEKSTKAIDDALLLIKGSKKRIADQRIFRKKSKVMTHCHSSEVVAFLKGNKNKIKKIYVTETRPRNQGIITAKELGRAGIPVIFIVDSAMGYYMQDTDAVIVGSDAIRKEGNVNKIGTLPMAITARAFGKKFYVVASKLKIDKRKKIEIEMRSPKEIADMKANILNPAFDITPWKYVTAVINEEGIMNPKRVLKGLR